ncbi:MAG TPA: DUF1932 domain-containing protein [Xanthobacteraceae bacterium]|jgi:3-hydroxyisobutyrate dehydrogenase|nr:DUF1932 domain-containing protein [Xanthobacteraceae bacterium]
MPLARVAIIGFGEVGRHFAHDLQAAGISEITAFDIAFGLPDSTQSKAANEQNVTICRTAGAAVEHADFVVSSVTAGSALDAARSVVGSVRHRPFFLDVNSVSPATKQEAAALIEAAGGRYVEAAVMTSVPPHGIRSPMLLGGPYRDAFIAHVAPLDMNLTAFSDKIGAASSVKMCRSVMIKGLEALTLECMLAAHFYGVEDDVLRSLTDTFPNNDWQALARYFISRSLLHGRRRAEEMREVARTVQDAGIDPLLSAPIAVRQDWAYAQGQKLEKSVINSEELETLLISLDRAVRDPARVKAT